MVATLGVRGLFGVEMRKVAYKSDNTLGRAAGHLGTNPPYTTAPWVRYQDSFAG